VTSHPLAFAPYELAFRNPLHTARGVITLRCGFLVALRVGNAVGIGDVAPLPDFGTETVEEAGQKLEEKRKTKNEKLDLELDCLDGFPATRFGLQCALLALEGQPSEGAREIPVNALIGGGTVREAWVAGQKAVEAGYETLKVKVGMRTVRQDIEIFRVLRSAFPKLALRADANGAWSFDEARQFAHGVTACELQYIEDPLKDPDTEALSVFRRNCEVPVACDRMADSVEDIEALIERRLCDVLVLKPSVIGSIRKLEQLADKAKAAGMAVVISSLLESSVGLSYVAHLAARCGTEGLAHGIGTAEMFETDMLRTPFCPVKGKIALPDLSALQYAVIPGMAAGLGLQESDE
jgi:o-succinylbenzoate synthase